MQEEWPPSKTFWEQEFPDKTKGRTSPYLFKGLLPVSRIGVPEVLEGIESLRNAHQQGVASAARVRVYVGEGRRDDLISSVLNTPAWNNPGQFVEWMQGVTEAERFSLVINNLEVTNETLSGVLGEFLTAIHSGWGVPVGGSEQAAFIGNYSGTAFGVHEGFEDAFLCHIGPGIKDFYCWDPELYVGLTGTTEPTFGDYLWLLEHGELFKMEPGDILFLPRRVYHVGRQTEFSISVAVPLYTYPNERYAQLAVLPELIRAATSEGSETPEPSEMLSVDFGVSEQVDRIAPIVRQTVDTLHANLETLLPEVLTHKWAALHSNGGWEIVENDLSREFAIKAAKNQTITAGDTVRLRKPYQIIPVDNESYYVRGVMVVIPKGALTEATIRDLNSWESVTVPTGEPAIDAIKTIASTGGLEK